MMRLKLDINEVRADEYVSFLIAQLATDAETQKTVDTLVERIVQVANSHIWGTIIMIEQDRENSEATLDEDNEAN